MLWSRISCSAFILLVETPPEGATTYNGNMPATVMTGNHSEFDYNVLVEITFADQVVYKAFERKVYMPDTWAQLAANEKFMDLSKLSMVLVGDVVETTKWVSLLLL